MPEKRGAEPTGLEPATIFLHLRYTLGLSNLQPIRSPFGPLPRTALDLDVRTARALVAIHISSPPKLICTRSCGSQIGGQ